MTKLELATALINKRHPTWLEDVKEYESRYMASHTKKETLQMWYDKEFKEVK